VGASGTVTCTNGSLANGASDAFTLVTNVAFSAAGSSVNNTATVSASTFDPANANNSSTSSTAVNAASPALSITKVLSSTSDNDSSGSITAGDQLNYTVTAKNTGNIPLTGVVVSDDHFPATQSCPALAMGAKLRAHRRLRGHRRRRFRRHRSPTIGSGHFERGRRAVHRFCVNTPVGTAADISITKTDATRSVRPARSSPTPITVANAGGSRRQHGQLDRRAARFAQLRVARQPCRLDLHDAGRGASGTSPATTARWPTAPATPSPWSPTSPSRRPAAPSTTPPRSARAPSIRPTRTFRPTSSTAVNAASPALSITKVLSSTNDNDSSGSITAGDQLNYTVTAKNTGNIPLTGVVVSDDHFRATQSCPALAMGANCVLTGGYVVTGADVSAGSITNLGSVSSNEAAGPFTSSVSTPIRGQRQPRDHQDRRARPGHRRPAAHVHDRRDQQWPASRGQRRDERRAARLARLRLAVGPSRWTCTTPAVGASGTVNCTIASLANAGTASFTLVAQVALSAGGSSVSNTATISAATFDPASTDNSATSTTAVTAAAASLQVTKVLSRHRRQRRLRLGHRRRPAQLQRHRDQQRQPTADERGGQR
jgi:hypothetical protein